MVVVNDDDDDAMMLCCSSFALQTNDCDEIAVMLLGSGVHHNC